MFSGPDSTRFVWGKLVMSVNVVYAVSRHFCYVGVFADLTDLVVRTLRCASRDVVTTCAY